MKAQQFAVQYRLEDGVITGWSTASGVDERAAEGCGVTLCDHEPDLDWNRVDVASGRVIDTSDPELAARLEAQFEHIAHLHPGLRNAVPPVPLQRQNGTFHIKHAEVWSDFVARASSGEWRARAPDESADSSVGPFIAYGDCLTPLSAEGEAHWYDPSLPAQDGDFVLIQWDARELEGIYKRGSGKPEWLNKYPVPHPLATKLLLALGNDYWLVTNSSMLRLGKNRILGVLCRRGPDDTRLVALAPRVTNISPNAATDILRCDPRRPHDLRREHGRPRAGRRELDRLH